jgi:acetyl-CoA synthetase
MGEPLSENVGQWFSKKFTFNRKQIINTYFQTETGGILCSRNYREKTKNILFSSVGKPINKLLGIFIDKSLEAKNEIKVSNLWPGCMINVINGKKFFNKYWDKKNNFRLFDKASIIKKNIMIHGRLDDVMNIRGHRIGSAEIENILLKLDEVYEAAAVSIYDKNQAEKLILFIVGKEISNKINIILNKYFGSYSLPEEIFFVNELPKTRSGKILRRLLKDIYENPSLNNYGDLSTIMNRKIVQIIKNKVISRAKI